MFSDRRNGYARRVDDVPALPDGAATLDRLVALCDPARRAAYFFVVERRGWVSRDAAATGLGMRRGLVAHHLDRLAADGLLDVEYRRLTGRSGPGAGRPAKLYRPSAARFVLTIPPRNPVVLAQVLAGAVADAGEAGHAVRDRALDRARRAGEALGGRARGSGSQVGRRRDLAGALASLGYSPYAAGGELALANCPYEPLSAEHRGLVCALNLVLIEGVVAGAGVRRVSCRLRTPPERGECCVRVGPWPAISPDPEA